jgi:hypothetical protein
MSKSKLVLERKILRAKIKHLDLDEKNLLVDGTSDKRGTLKPNVHPFVKELLSSR